MPALRDGAKARTDARRSRCPVRRNGRARPRRTDALRRRLCGCSWNYDEAARFRGEMDERLAAFGLCTTPEKIVLLNFDASLFQRGTEPTTSRVQH